MTVAAASGLMLAAAASCKRAVSSLSWMHPGQASPCAAASPLLYCLALPGQQVAARTHTPWLSVPLLPPLPPHLAAASPPRYRDKLMDKRNRVVEDLLKEDPNFKAPPDYRPRRYQRKIMIPIQVGGAQDSSCSPRHSAAGPGAAALAREGIVPYRAAMKARFGRTMHD